MALDTALVKGAFDLVNQLYTTDEERAQGQLKVLELAQAGTLAQMKVNAAEAGTGSIFIGGWRPAVGWTCAIAFMMTFVIFPFMHTAATYYWAFTGESVDLSGLPDLDMAEMMPVLFGMLGLGAYRTYEKKQGIAR